MNRSTQRYTVFFLLVLLGQVSRSQGMKSFGKNILSPTTIATGKAEVKNIHASTDISALVTSKTSDLLFHFRGGGEIYIPDDDDDNQCDDSILLTKLRNTIRNILQFGDKKLPSIFSELLRSCFKTVETITGISLLPSKATTKKKSVNNGKQKKKISKAAANDNKSKKKKKNENESSEEETGKTKKKKPIKKKSSSSSNAKKKPSAATTKHLAESIKSTNPNYRIQKELKAFIKSPPPNLTVQVGSNIRLWVVTMVGAKNTIYEGEVFKLRIMFPPQYPTVPPSVYFLKGNMPTHEHVYTNGDICLSLLGKDWRPTMSAQSIAVSILSILSSAGSKSLPMDNASHATNKPGKYQKDWVYHDDRC
jgi:ubiquitin-conjugating enzyme E2 W